MNHSTTSLLRCLLVATLGLLLSTCNKDSLPQPTQTGQNTFGCLINGKSYVPDGGTGFMPAKPIDGGFVGIYATPYRIGIDLYTTSKDKQHIELFLNDYKIGQHLLNFDTVVYPILLDPKDYGMYESSSGENYVTSAKYTGSVNLTKADTSSGILSGTFEFTGATHDGKTVTISKGRFDVRLPAEVCQARG